MPVKITNIGGPELHRYYDECPYCGGEMYNAGLYGDVCIEDCDGAKKESERKNAFLNNQNTEILKENN